MQVRSGLRLSGGAEPAEAMLGVWANASIPLARVPQARRPPRGVALLQDGQSWREGCHCPRSSGTPRAISRRESSQAQGWRAARGVGGGGSWDWRGVESSFYAHSYTDGQLNKKKKR